MEYFEVLKPIAARDPDAQASLQITVQQTEDVIVTLQQAQQKAIDVFKHWVTVEPGPDLYTLQQAIDELEIPPTWEDAYQIATQKSPDVRQASEQIEMVKDQIKAARAALCPQIEVNASYGLSKSFDGVSNLGSRVGSTQAGFGVTVNLFNKAGRDVLKYQRATLHANELAKQAAEDDAQYSLRKTYRDLENQLTNQKSQAALLQKLIRNIKNSELDIKNQLHLPDPNTSGAVISFITSKLGILNNLGTTWNQLATTMSEILQDKFSVLQAEGTLFDSTN
jgi:outer membrane protein TolC